MTIDVELRVVEVLRVGAGRGSGYAIAANLVITAAHVVADDVDVLVVVGNEELLGKVVWRNLALDAALVRVHCQRWDGLETSWAQLSGVQPVLCTAIGYPRVQKTTDGVRVEEHIYGFVMPVTGRRINRYAINVTSAMPYEPSRADSPWSGLSGAAVLTGDGHHVIGVITDDPVKFEPSRLEAVPVSELLKDDVFIRLVGAHSNNLITVNGGDVKADVTGKHNAPDRSAIGRPPWWTRSGYIEQVRDIAPTGGLRDRDTELAELTAFCAGEEPYVWWRAGPWAGKTALLSSFVLDPPSGVDIVSFFVTARLAAQADSNAFTDALLDQLSAIVGESSPPSLTPTARDAHRRALLHAANQKARKDGRRLVLVVDGLDEDCGTDASLKLPSVASLLPKAPEDGLRIIVASRPNPELPFDVHRDHPLRHCRVRDLAASPHAAELAHAASAELDAVLHGDQAQQDVVGLITACGGGLTIDDLEELTGLPRYRLDSMLRGVFGRTIGGRAEQMGNDVGRVYLFTHETLRKSANRRLGSGLKPYVIRLHGWAERYSRLGWPGETPQYLLRGYPRMLQDMADFDRLATLATNPSRHNRLLELTGGDAAAFAEVETAHKLVSAQDEIDVLAIIRLAVHRERLYSRNANLPTDLPAVWIRLGQPTRAEALAQGISSPLDRDQALLEVVQALADRGTIDHAEDLALRILDPDRMTRAITVVVQALAIARQLDRAETLAWTITAPFWQARAQSAIVEAMAVSGDAEKAEALAKTIVEPIWRAQAIAAAASIPNTQVSERLATEARNVADRIADPYRRSEAFAAVAMTLARAGKVDHAEAIVSAITDRGWRAEVLTSLVEYFVATGDVADAKRIAQSISGSDRRAPALVALSRAIAITGELDEAESIASSVAIDDLRARALASIVKVALINKDHKRAERLAADAELSIGRVRPITRRATALVGLAVASSEGGDADRFERLIGEAETILRNIADPARRARALARLALEIPAAGDAKRAERLAIDAENLARSITDSDRDARALAALVETLVSIGELDRAEALARSVKDSYRRAQLLVDVAEAAAITGDVDRADDMAQGIAEPGWREQARVALFNAAMKSRDIARAEVIAQSMSDATRQARALTSVAKAVALAGDARRAESIAFSIVNIYASNAALSAVAAASAEAVAVSGDIDGAVAKASAITDVYSRDSALNAVVKVVAMSGGVDRARTLADSIRGQHSRIQALTEVARAAALAGDIDGAYGIASTIADSYQRADALTAVAEGAAAAGDFDRAFRIANSIANHYRRVTALTAAVEAAAKAGIVDRAEAIADTIDYYSRGKALIAIARAAAATGEADRADVAAHSVFSLEQRRQAVAAATAVAAPKDARRILIAAIRRDWTTSLQALAEMEPEAVVSLADDRFADVLEPGVAS